MKKIIVVDGEEYVKASSVKQAAESVDGMPYVVVRTYSAGVFAGYLKSRSGKEVALVNARRLWYWKGAASLSQLAMEGVSCPDSCKFPCAVIAITLTEAVEIIEATQEARQSIEKVKIWKA